MVAPLAAAAVGTVGRAVFGQIVKKIGEEGLKKGAATVGQGALQGAAGFGMSQLLGNLFNKKGEISRDDVTAKLNQHAPFKALSDTQKKQVVDYVMSQAGTDNKLNKQEATSAIQEALNALKAKPSKV